MIFTAAADSWMALNLSGNNISGCSEPPLFHFG